MITIDIGENEEKIHHQNDDVLPCMLNSTLFLLISNIVTIPIINYLIDVCPDTQYMKVISWDILIFVIFVIMRFYEMKRNLSIHEQTMYVALITPDIVFFYWGQLQYYFYLIYNNCCQNDMKYIPISNITCEKIITDDAFTDIKLPLSFLIMGLFFRYAHYRGWLKQGSTNY